METIPQILSESMKGFAPLYDMLSIYFIAIVIFATAKVVFKKRPKKNR